MKKGLFITLEGVEGGGKSTQTKLLYSRLQEEGIDCIVTREPGGSEGAEAIRELLVNGTVSRWDGITELLLMFAARRDHVEKTIKPALEEGKVVICDRFFDSSYAYQGYGHNLDLKKIDAVREVTIENFQPDMTFILDLDIHEGINRKNTQNERNRFEDMKLEFHQRVRDGFLEIAKKDSNRCELINAGSLSIETIHSHIFQKIKTALESR